MRFRRFRYWYKLLINFEGITSQARAVDLFGGWTLIGVSFFFLEGGKYFCLYFAVYASFQVFVILVFNLFNRNFFTWYVLWVVIVFIYMLTFMYVVVDLELTIQYNIISDRPHWKMFGDVISYFGFFLLTYGGLYCTTLKEDI